MNYDPFLGHKVVLFYRCMLFSQYLDDLKPSCFLFGSHFEAFSIVTSCHPSQASHRTRPDFVKRKKMKSWFSSFHPETKLATPHSLIQKPFTANFLGFKLKIDCITTNPGLNQIFIDWRIVKHFRWDNLIYFLKNNNLNFLENLIISLIFYRSHGYYVFVFLHLYLA